MSSLTPKGNRRFPRRPVPMLGVEVTPLDAGEVVDTVLQHVETATGLIVGNLNLHGVYMFHTDQEFAAFCESSDLILIDGAPIAWAAGQQMSKRVGSTDWIDVLMPRASNLQIVAVGGTQEASQAAQRHMRERFPAVNWIGIDGYSCHQPDDQLRQTIAKSQLVLVGMGMPLQERWINQNRELLERKIVANVGGCFDYYAGVQQLAPRWMGSVGIEWLYRLGRSPKRLAGRYLVEPLRLAMILLRMRATQLATRR